MLKISNILFALLPCTFLIGQSYTDTEYFTQSDTLFIEVIETDHYGYTAYYPYTLKPRNTLYSLSKWFGVSIEEIKRYNPLLLTKMPQLGDTIRMPIQFHHQPLEKSSSQQALPLCYKIKQGETLYTIAKKYFKLEVKDLRNVANLSSSVLEINQAITVGYLTVPASIDKIMKHDEVQAELVKEGGEVIDTTLEYIDQKGIALWKDIPSNGEPFVLHREAKIGSKLRVINPMFNSTIDAKVIGRLPDHMYREDITVILSSDAARSLGALDKRFYVKIRYIK